MKRKPKLTKRERKAQGPARPQPEHQHQHIHCIACGKLLDPAEDAERVAQRLGEVVGLTDRVSSTEEIVLAVRAFVEAGLRPLERVVLQLHNMPEFVYAFFALIRAGCIPVMALRAHRHTEVKHFLSASGATGYVIPDVLRGFDYRAMAEEMRTSCPGLRHVFVSGDPLPGQHSLASLFNSAACETPRLDPSEVALMLLSGGTTSLSKLTRCTGRRSRSRLAQLKAATAFAAAPKPTSKMQSSRDAEPASLCSSPRPST